ncbi:MAG TPA: hypothetical protein VMT22_20560 [Terriglobales bacterium]|nr:hypothetical protein [Terriglobales bacterium]
MTESIIPEEVARFVLDNIYSVAHLEALLLLHSNPDQAWSASRLAARLYISEEQTAELLLALRAQGLIAEKAQQPGSFEYKPASTDLDLMIKRLAQIHAKHLVPITNLIHSKPKPRIQEFADAFRLRKGE